MSDTPIDRAYEPWKLIKHFAINKFRIYSCKKAIQSDVLDQRRIAVAKQPDLNYFLITVDGRLWCNSVRAPERNLMMINLALLFLLCSASVYKLRSN
jgi:hypothetical protein